MNVENLLKVKALILEEPLRFDMGLWRTTHPEACGIRAPKCGTVACIAGWGATLHFMEKDKRLKKLSTAAGLFMCSETPEIAAGFFGIDDGSNLFFESNWPEDLQERLDEETQGTAEYAQIAAEAIDRFIACDGNWAYDKGPGAEA